MTADDAQVLARFLDADGRIPVLPTKQAKLRVVLAHVAAQLEPGRAYAEPEVNALLGDLHDDHAALRRYLVEAGLVDREGGVYTRRVSA